MCDQSHEKYCFELDHICSSAKPDLYVKQTDEGLSHKNWNLAAALGVTIVMIVIAVNFFPTLMRCLSLSSRQGSRTHREGSTPHHNDTQHNWLIYDTA